MSLPKLLLVEDDSDWMDIYYQNLAGNTYEIVQASSQEQALAILTENEISVVLTDLKLIGSASEFGGFELATRQL